MEIQGTAIKDCKLITCKRFHDNRGWFQQLFSAKDYAEFNKEWQQINWSDSVANVLRGIHEAPFSKLVTCVAGRVFDVVVDLRPDSPTYLRWDGFWLQGGESTQVFVPPGCGHGFFAPEKSQVMYLQDALYAPGNETDWNYESFDIDWPLNETHPGEYIISDRDRKAQRYSVPFVTQN